MIVFLSRLKLNGSMIVLIVTCLSGLFIVTEGLLSNPTTKSLVSRRAANNLPFHGQLNRISYPALVGCKSKRDPSLDRDEEYTVKTETKNELDDFDSKIRDSNKTYLPDKNVSATTPPQSLSTPVILFATVLFVSFWPLLALLRFNMSNINGIETNIFMALKGIIETSPMTDMDSTIVELPSLSPAEQLVGSIFGPPK
mmetsp:Transcript_40647/g.46207  ORF Transcript_40647/g.46207 Transcript_40647/m.46207 type:complete len:198 (+) Transcript_40647:152-745(+)